MTIVHFGALHLKFCACVIMCAHALIEVCALCVCICNILYIIKESYYL